MNGPAPSGNISSATTWGFIILRIVLHLIQCPKSKIIQPKDTDSFANNQKIMTTRLLNTIRSVCNERIFIVTADVKICIICIILCVWVVGPVARLLLLPNVKWNFYCIQMKNSNLSAAFRLALHLIWTHSLNLPELIERQNRIPIQFLGQISCQ